MSRQNDRFGNFILGMLAAACVDGALFVLGYSLLSWRSLLSGMLLIVAMTAIGNQRFDGTRRAQSGEGGTK